MKPEERQRRALDIAEMDMPRNLPPWWEMVAHGPDKKVSSLLKISMLDRVFDIQESGHTTRH